MGWAVGDADKVEEASVNLSKTKAAFYNLDKSIQKIGHQEKREVLKRHLAGIATLLDFIEQDLDR